MNPHIQRAELPSQPAEAFPPTRPTPEDDTLDLGFDQIQWGEERAERESQAAGGRRVLAGALTILAILWVAFTAWSAGRVMASQSLTSPAVAQWLAIAAGP